MASEISAIEGQAATKTKRSRPATIASDGPWTRQAPARLAAHPHPADAFESWVAWQKYVVRRRRPKPVDEVFHSKTHPLLWNAPSDAVTGELRELLSAISSKNGKAKHAASLAEHWLEQDGAATSNPDPASALCELAWAHLLPKLAGVLNAQVWWGLVEALCQRADERRGTKIDEHSDGLEAWADQILRGELPLTLAYQFPELAQCAGLDTTASNTLTAGLVGLTDGEGLLHARHLPWLRPLLACWTRSLGIAQAGGLNPWTEDAQAQFEWLLRQALRLTRSDGSQACCDGAAGAWQPDLFSSALKLAGDAEDVAAARLLLPGDLRVNDVDELPCEPAVTSEWSQVAVLRTHWKPSAPFLAVNYAGGDVIIELEVGRESLLRGAWSLEIACDTASLRPEAWEEMCWFSDDDVDYLEISADLPGGGRVDRQILLAREDQFLFLCDNIVHTSGSSLEVSSRLPLAGGMEPHAEQETREIQLVGRKPRALVMPLALPEWRIDKRAGELEHAGGTLHLRQRGMGSSLACPLFFDLQPRRLTKQRTWRQLTVAESLQICSQDTAAAYRIQCGMAQWIFYRSLAPPGNRTVFGQNLSTEFFVARFHRDGEIEELLEVEGEI